MRASSFPIGVGLATSSGCLWFLACTPFDLAPLAWVASLPMLLAVEEAPTLRRALLLGWWAGVIETGGGFYWIIDTTQRFAGFPWIGGAAVLVLFCATRALIFLLFTAIVCGIRRRRPVPMVVLAPLAMAASEYLVPQIFPCGQWITQAWHPLLIQISDLTGPYGVTALLMMVNGALYDAATALRAGQPRVAYAPLLGAAAVLGAALAYGAVRMQAIDALRASAPTLKVGLVQPNIPNSSTGDFSAEEAAHELAGLTSESQRLERLGADITVWSEGAYPVALPRTLGIDFPPDSPARIRRGLEAPLLAGVAMYDAEGERFYNSALLLERHGEVAGHYDKVNLLAFGEYIPGLSLFPWLRNVLPAGTGGYTPGGGPAVLSLSVARGGPSWALGPLICYEDILPGYVHQVGRLHPNLLVNLTVDSWYGARAEPWEHLALAVFGSVEVRTDMVRAVNSGVSALIDANGRVLSKTYADDPYRHPLPPDGIVVTPARMPGGNTLYVRFGDWFAMLAVLTCAALGALAWRAPRGPQAPREPQAPPAPRAPSRAPSR
jgi:apolipoprotein N-acyltransferase